MTRTSGSGTRRRCAAGAGRAWPANRCSAQRRHQVTDVAPAPAPKVTEHVAQAKECPCCGTVTEGELPRACAGAGQLRAGGVRAGREPGRRAPRSGLPGDAAAVRSWPGSRVSAGLDGRDPREGRRAGRGQRVHGPGRGSCCGPRRRCTPTRPRPARPAGCGTCTWPAPRYLTLHAHRGQVRAPRSTLAACCPATPGVIVRDGYSGYGHLTDALHAWCGAHLLRDLKDLYDFEPAKQDWAEQMASLLDRGPRRRRAPPARAGQAALDAAVLDRPAHPLPGARRRRAGREPLPAHRYREGRPPPRPPVPAASRT